MKISLEFGPQFDYRDGTIGELKLVKRWVIVKSCGNLWSARQGRNTFKTRREVVAKLRKAVAANKDRAVEMRSLRVAAWWCYPGHFDPVGPMYPCRCRTCLWLEDGGGGPITADQDCSCSVCDALREDSQERRGL